MWIIDLYMFLKNRTGQPLGFLFLIVDLIVKVFKEGFSGIFLFLSKRLFLAESIIRENVSIAVNNPELFGWYNAYLLISSFFVWFFVLFLIVKIINFFTGTNNTFGVWALTMLFIYPAFEIMGYYISGGTGIFIPFVHGLFYFVKNFHFVILSFSNLIGGGNI